MLSDKFLYSTGNILSLNEIKKKAALNSRDELIETLKITLQDAKIKGDASNTVNGVDISPENVDRKDIKLTVKIFLSNSDSKSLKEALEQVYKVLKTDTIESLVIVLNKEDSGDVLLSLQTLWTILEEYYNKGKLMSIGVSDLDTEKFIQLFNWANIKPNIIQINLATCCVVPPALQEFTKQNDIQLLTHSDPNPILTKEPVNELFGEDAVLKWVARYQVHIRCRGVLSSKGYLVQINKPTLA